MVSDSSSQTFQNPPMSGSSGPPPASCSVAIAATGRPSTSSSCPRRLLAFAATTVSSIPSMVSTTSVALARPSMRLPARRSTSAAFIITQARAKSLCSRRVDSTAPSSSSRASWSRPSIAVAKPWEIVSTDTRWTWPVARATAMPRRPWRGLRVALDVHLGQPEELRRLEAVGELRVAQVVEERGGLVAGAQGGSDIADERIDERASASRRAACAGRPRAGPALGAPPQVRTPSTSRRWKASTASVMTRASSSSFASPGSSASATSSRAWAASSSPRRCSSRARVTVSPTRSRTSVGASDAIASPGRPRHLEPPRAAWASASGDSARVGGRRVGDQPSASPYQRAAEAAPGRGPPMPRGGAVEASSSPAARSGEVVRVGLRRCAALEQRRRRPCAPRAASRRPSCRRCAADEGMAHREAPRPRVTVAPGRGASASSARRLGLLDIRHGATCRARSRRRRSPRHPGRCGRRG